jgi:cell division septation protein DedD
MGDDFDLFPKRENLDPFSFKTREKKTEPLEESEDLFGEREQPSPRHPDKPTAEPSASEPEVADAAPPGPLPDLEPPPGTGVQPEPMSLPESEGPISESKTFDEVDDDIMPPPGTTFRPMRKTPSPFIVVGGALLIIIGLLYLALTFLKRDRPIVPTIQVPEVSVPVEPRSTEVVPGQESEMPEKEAQGEPASEEQPASEVVEPSLSEQQGPAVVQEVEEPPAAEPDQTAAETVKPEEETPVAAASVATVPEGGRYSVQTGAFILEASVREQEKKLASLGYETFRKEGSTTALMNTLTVGPFSDIEEARKAVSEIRDAGIDSNLVRQAGGEAIVNAGSYLLDENANRIEGKIRSMGYPVALTKKQARLPMTFLRIGRFEEISEASGLKDELKEKGLDAIVVKLQ